MLLNLHKPLFVTLAAASWGYPADALAFKKFGADWTYEHSTHRIDSSFEICTANTPSGAFAATMAAGAAWNYQNFRFSFQPNGCSSSGTFPVKNGVNQIDFGPIDTGVPAISKVYYDGTNITECDIRFNSMLKWNTSTKAPSKNQWDLISVATHEFGHCLGLADENQPFSNDEPVMNGMLGAGDKRRILTTDDKNGRNSLYGKIEINRSKNKTWRLRIRARGSSLPTNCFET
jgi:hypothetical protein